MPPATCDLKKNGMGLGKGALQGHFIPKEEHNYKNKSDGPLRDTQKCLLLNPRWATVPLKCPARRTCEPQGRRGLFPVVCLVSPLNSTMQK